VRRNLAIWRMFPAVRGANLGPATHSGAPDLARRWSRRPVRDGGAEVIKMDDARMAVVTAASTQPVLHEREGRDRGYAISQELPGDDRPEDVAALYRDAFVWAGLGPPGSAEQNERMCGVGPRPWSGVGSRWQATAS
jgi:hypothetical protein